MKKHSRSRIALTGMAALSLLATAAPRPVATPHVSAQMVTITVDAALNRHAIDPRIYGVAFVNFNPATGTTDLGATINRWGGNATSRHNWFVNTTNRAKDYYFENQPDEPSNVPGAAADAFVTATRANELDALITIPMMGILPFDHQIRCGYTPGNNNCCQFVDNDHNCGDGRSILDGSRLKFVNTVSDTSNIFPPSHQGQWIEHLKNTHGDAAEGGVRYYGLDNEPSLWSFDHWDVHPDGSTSQEVWDDMATYGALIKATDPAALTTGPEEWGWDGYFYSGVDQENFPDVSEYAANGPYTRYLLNKAREYEETNGTRILDFFTLHFYPQNGEFCCPFNDVSPTMQGFRNRSTRALWDPNYQDESYIGGTGLDGGIVRLIPRMREWTNNDYPGTKIGITEYNWGAEGTGDPGDIGNINGATAQADILGILGREGADMAVRWTAPPNQNGPTLVYNAFKMFRNYDGLGTAQSRFGDLSVSASSAVGAIVDGTDADNVSTFAAIRSDNKLTIMIVSKTASLSDVTVNVSNFQIPGSMQVYRLTASNTITGPTTLSRNPSGNFVLLSVPGQSITLLVADGSFEAAPTNLFATAMPDQQSVSVSWTGPANATYHVFRKAGADPFIELPAAPDPTVTFYSDTTVSAGTCYLYKVQADNGSGLRSGDSNVDVATPFVFTDDLASPGPPFDVPVVTIKAVHINELRTVIDAMRTAAGIGPGTYTNVPIVAGTTPVTAEHIRELRRALNQARAWLGLPPIAYTGVALTPNLTLIDRHHVNDLRDGVK